MCQMKQVDDSSSDQDAVTFWQVHFSNPRLDKTSKWLPATVLHKDRGQKRLIGGKDDAITEVNINFNYLPW